MMTDRSIPIRILGPVEVTTRAGAVPLGGPKQRALFAMLVARVGRVVTVDQLVDGIWGEEPPAAVTASIHSYVSNLRTSFEYPIERHGSGYSLQAKPTAVDGHVFEADVEAGRKDLIANSAAASDLLRQALGLWRGRAYADVAVFPGLSNEAIRLEELRLSAVETRIEADLALGRHSSLVSELEALAAEYPLRESLRAKHMVALYRDGRQGEALRAFRRTQDYLREELGIDPSDELQKLEERILNHDYTLIHSKEVVSEEMTLLFIEIVDAGSMWEEHPAEMNAAVEGHHELVRAAIESAGGTVARTSANGTLASFSEPAMAVRAAAQSQQEISARDWSPLDLSVRMALDIGEVERRGGDLFGPPLNRGSRLVAAAHGQQILLSADAQRLIGREAGVQLKSLGEHQFTALGRAEDVYQLVVDGLPIDFPALRPSRASRARSFGDTIGGYELRGETGRGAFTTVYRGFQPAMGRVVAVKIVRPEYANHPAYVRRFESETRLAASLEHPHVVSGYDYWRDADGAYVVGPYMPGGPVAGRLTVERVLEIAGQVGSALSYAHRHGVIHGNIKPSNILLDADGNAYLGDFGTAARSVEEATGLFSAGAGYRAPEGSDGAAVDSRSDIYSLAAVITHLITGDPPDAFHLGAVDPRLRPALEQGLAQDPEDRPGSVDEFLALINGAPEEPEGDASHFRNPYKGLAAFQTHDAPDFFGREEEIRRLVDLVAEHRLSAIVGPSGSGKSSLVLAGVLPALAYGAVSGSESWVGVHAVPGAYPFDELATALSQVATEPLPELAEQLSSSDGRGLVRVSTRIADELGGDLVLVIDQFEELFNLVTSEETPDRFVTALVNAANDLRSRVRIVLSLRADFFHQALSLPLLGPIIGKAHLAIASLATDGIREAIIKPAERANLDLEPGLADRITADLADEPGGLPLLQFTLHRLATMAEQGVITNADYDTLGGVQGAISERAEAAYQTLTGLQHDVAKHIFTRLLYVSEDADDIRRRVRVSEFRSLGLDRADVDAVLDTFGRERLLTFDIDRTTRGGTVEVAHEALLREWSTLRSWVAARRESLSTQRRFQTVLAEWEESNRSPDSLLTGGRLIQYQEWAGEGVVLTEREREFLDASIDYEARRWERSRRRRLEIMAVLGGVTLMAVVFGLAARQTANKARAEAIASDAILSLETDPELAALLAVEAYNRAPIDSTEAALHQALQRQRAVTTIPATPGPSGWWGSIGPDGKRVTLIGLETTDLQMWEIGADGPTWETTLSDDASARFLLFAHVSWSADGSRVYVPVSLGESGDSEGVGLYTVDAATGAKLDFLRFPCLVRALPAGGQFAADSGLWVVEWVESGGSSCDAEDMVGVVDITSGEIVFQVQAEAGKPSSLSADGKHMAVSGFFSDARTRVFDTTDGRIVFDFEATVAEGDSHGVLSRDGSKILVGQNPVLLYDVASGERLQTYQGDFLRVVFTPDERGVVGVSSGGTVHLFDTGSGEELIVFNSQAAGPATPSLDLRGDRLVTSSFDGVRVWDVASEARGTLDSFSLEAVEGGLFFNDALTGSARYVLVRRGRFEKFSNRPYLGGQPHRIDILNAEDGSLVRTLDVWYAELATDDVLFVQPVGESGVVSPSGVDDASHIGPPRLIDPATGATLVELAGCDWYWISSEEQEPGPGCEEFEARMFSKVSFAANGSTVLGSEMLGAMTVWERSSGKIVQQFTSSWEWAALDYGMVWSAALSPDGASVINLPGEVDDPPTLHGLNVSTGERTSAVEGYNLEVVPSDWVHGLEFNSDAGKMIGFGRDLLLVDPEQMTATTLKAPQGGFIEDVAVSPDGRLAATAGLGGLIVVWDLSRGAILIEIPVAGVESGGLRGVAFTDNETLIVAPTRGERLLRFTIDPEVLVDRARNDLDRGFDPEECATYDIDPCPGLDEMKAGR
jgi:serine/threonine protein kinase/DNA-binding SARP family transcriptional activator/WD40 repeat protein